MKKALSTISIIIGGLFLLSVAVPMIIEIILKTQVVSIVSADGPTAVFIAGTVGRSNSIIETLLGILFIVAGV